LLRQAALRALLRRNTWARQLLRRRTGSASKLLLRQAALRSLSI
jgi:hypothetical protein